MRVFSGSSSSGQIDFYDDPGLIAIGADAVARFFTAAARQ